MNTNPITNHEAKVIGTLADGSKTYLRSTNSYASYMYENYYNSPNIYSTYNKTIGNNSFSVMAGFRTGTESITSRLMQNVMTLYPMMFLPCLQQPESRRQTVQSVIGLQGAFLDVSIITSRKNT